MSGLSEKLDIRIRLLPDQADRIEKIAHARGQSRQAFATAAIMAEVAVGEEDLNLKKKHRVRSEEDDKSDDDKSTPAIRGLGLTSKISREDDSKYQAPTPTAPPPVVVNVGAGAGGSGNSNGNHAPNIEGLAQYVITGPAYERDARLRTAVDLIKAGCPGESERVALANQLDQEIAKREPKPESVGAFRTARLAFDKLKSFLDK